LEDALCSVYFGDGFHDVRVRWRCVRKLQIANCNVSGIQYTKVDSGAFTVVRMEVINSLCSNKVSISTHLDAKHQFESCPPFCRNLPKVNLDFGSPVEIFEWILHTGNLSLRPKLEGADITPLLDASLFLVVTA